MEPTAPPYYSIQNSPSLHDNSVDIRHSKEGHSENNIQSISTFSTNRPLKHNYTNPECNDNKNNSSENIYTEGILLKGRCNDMCEKSYTNKHHPYEKCQNQLCKMDSSLDTPSYENVARFHEQQRQIATELETKRHFTGKNTKLSYQPNGYCQYCRADKSNISTATEKTSVCNFSNCQKRSNSTNNKMCTGNYF